jgi:hypothetical protein
MEDNIDRRNLTEEEYIALPLELKICFYLAGWNISANIHSVEDWINTFYFWYDSADEHDDNYKGDGKTNAMKEYQKLYDLISNIDNNIAPIELRKK